MPVHGRRADGRCLHRRSHLSSGKRPPRPYGEGVPDIFTKRGITPPLGGRRGRARRAFSATRAPTGTSGAPSSPRSSPGSTPPSTRPGTTRRIPASRRRRGSPGSGRPWPLMAGLCHGTPSCPTMRTGPSAATRWPSYGPTSRRWVATSRIRTSSSVRGWPSTSSRSATSGPTARCCRRATCTRSRARSSCPWRDGIRAGSTQSICIRRATRRGAWARTRSS